jgi:hypothetical protein
VTVRTATDKFVAERASGGHGPSRKAPRFPPFGGAGLAFVEVLPSYPAATIVPFAPYQHAARLDQRQGDSRDMAKSTTPRSTTPRTTTPRATAARKPRAAKPAAAAPVAAPKLVVATRTPAEAEIALRAYELFLENGSRHGFDVEHWLQAERELRSQRMTSAA